MAYKTKQEITSLSVVSSSAGQIEEFREKTRGRVHDDDEILDEEKGIEKNGDKYETTTRATLLLLGGYD